MMLAPFALTDNSTSNRIKFVGCLIIVFRLRNNLFHGEKWSYHLRNQGDNFKYANNFLKSVMSHT